MTTFQKTFGNLYKDFSTFSYFVYCFVVKLANLSVFFDVEKCLMHVMHHIMKNVFDH